MVNTPSKCSQERVTAAVSALLCRYSGEWEKTVHRLGRWIDFENDYKTLDPTFMESVWWAFSELYAKGLVYRGFKARPACSRNCRCCCNEQAKAVELHCPLLAHSNHAACR
jgi:isoleucyl-tRNA synthetase